MSYCQHLINSKEDICIKCFEFDFNELRKLEDRINNTIKGKEDKCSKR